MEECLHMWEEIAHHKIEENEVGNKTLWCPVCGSVKRVYYCQKHEKTLSCESKTISNKTGDSE